VSRRRSAPGAAFADARDLVADPGVDAVVIASPPDTHVMLVLACLEAGKPVLCEKPLAATAADTRRAWVASIAGGVPAGARAEDGHPAALVCEAAMESVRTGKPVDVATATGAQAR
jgi:predicted dehydrogenase